MISQVAQLPYEKELIFATSSKYNEFYSKFGRMDNYKFPVSVIGGADSCGAGRNLGGQMASGDTLLYMDCHVCFSPESVSRVITTLKTRPNAIVAPSLQPIEFPECTPMPGVGKGHGVAFRFANHPFEWVWLPSETDQHEYTSPFVCGCAFMMSKNTFNVLNTHGGFLKNHTGLGLEEEISMRLWRLGHPTFVEPRATFGHLLKGYPGHATWDNHSTSGFYLGRVSAFYVNVFNKSLWDDIEGILMRTNKDEYLKSLELAKRDYSWVRELMRPYKDKINERWFFRTV